MLAVRICLCDVIERLKRNMKTLFKDIFILHTTIFETNLRSYDWWNSHIWSSEKFTRNLESLILPVIEQLEQGQRC
jgi:hypothetical protein